MPKRKQEPTEVVKKRTRAFRKRLREDLKRDDSFISTLRSYFKEHGLPEGRWAFASDVYKQTEVLNLFLSFSEFIEAIRGDKKKQIKPVRSIEIAEASLDGDVVYLIRPVKSPEPKGKNLCA